MRFSGSETGGLYRKSFKNPIEGGPQSKGLGFRFFVRVQVSYYVCSFFKGSV